MKIAIVGGGLVGGLAAVSMARALSHQLKVSIDVFERFPRPEQDSLSYQEQYNARNLVLSSATAAFLEDMALWENLKHLLVPIKSLKVSRLHGLGHSTIESQDEGVNALGYVADMALLAKAIATFAEAETAVNYHYSAEIKSIKPKNAGYQLAFSTPDICTDYDLVMVADGQKSWVCDALGIASDNASYGQHALVTNVTLTEDVAPVAYEQFIPGGALTLLPLTQSGFNRRMALVWIDSEATLKELESMPESQFLQELSQRLSLDAEYVEKGNSQIYPLNYQLRHERVRPHLVIIGNAAQSLHPIAAQGFNLAVRDVRDFIQMTLLHLENNNKELFSGAWMAQFSAKRQADVSKVSGFVSTLTKVFFKSSAMPIRGFLQDFALAGFELIPGAKRALSQFAMGGQKKSGRIFRERGVRGE